jgi:hypothetical protein
MHKRRVKGKLDHSVSGAKRNVVGWADDTKVQVESAAEEVRARAGEAWDKMKEVADLLLSFVVPSSRTRLHPSQPDVT